MTPIIKGQSNWLLNPKTKTKPKPKTLGVYTMTDRREETIERIKTIRSAIRDKKARWSAGWTSMADLTDEERKMHLGLIVDKEEMRKTEAKFIEEDALTAYGRTTYIYPEKWDWRNVHGKDWTTPVKKQGICGSCVAFATVATVESNYEIFKRDPYLNPNLSEADLFFCGGGKCVSGWDIQKAIEYAEEKGIPDQECFPYKARDRPCKPCADRDERALKVDHWRKIYSESKAKEWISRKGPVMTGMEVYEDFHYYRKGIYKHLEGEEARYHAIAIVGYNDLEQYWICKNSWGTLWGEKGWFKIAYGEGRIGKTWCFFTVEFRERR